MNTECTLTYWIDNMSDLNLLKRQLQKAAEKNLFTVKRTSTTEGVYLYSLVFDAELISPRNLKHLYEYLKSYTQLLQDVTLMLTTPYFKITFFTEFCLFDFDFDAHSTNP